MNNNIIIYTSSLCGFCYRAKSLLKKKNIPFEEINIDVHFYKDFKNKFFRFFFLTYYTYKICLQLNFLKFLRLLNCIQVLG